MKAMPSECGPASLFKLSVAWDEILPSSHFTDEFMEAQRGEAPCPGMPSNEAAGIGFEPILKELCTRMHRRRRGGPGHASFPKVHCLDYTMGEVSPQGSPYLQQ
jgi:hypothetical protein